MRTADLVVITTKHSSIDWRLVRDHARLVLDTRGVRGSPERAGWHTL